MQNVNKNVGTNRYVVKITDKTKPRKKRKHN